MTNEEAIEIINRENDPNDKKVWELFPEYREALDIAIQASRDMEEIVEIMKCDADAETKCKMISNILTAKPHYFKEQKPTDRIEYGTDGNAYKLWISNGKEYEQEPCDDAISCEAVCNIVNDIRDCISVEGYWAILERLKKLPSVTQKSSDEQLYKNGFADGYEQGHKDAEPKTGHWILDETDNSITCDKCGCRIWANDISNGDAHYCPNCGCRKVEPQESEKVNCKSTKCDNCINHNYCDFEPQESEDKK